MSAQIREFLPPILSRPVNIWLTTTPPPAHADIRLALFETLQLVNNSHCRVKKPDHSDTGCTHVFLLDNSIPKDGVDREVNVTNGHDIGITWHDTQA